MENMKKDKTIEEIRHMIVNHPVKAYMKIGVDFTRAINENSEKMLSHLKCAARGALVTLKCLLLFGRCVLCAIRHMILLAFYPIVKLYYIVGARREIMRNHPEYISPRHKGQMR
jgi:hypothetical protein